MNKEERLLQNFLNNKCGPEELEKVYELLQTKKGLEAYQALVNNSNPKQEERYLSAQEEETKELVFGRLKESIERDKLSKKVYKTQRISVWFKRAAVLVLFLSASIMLFSIIGDYGTEEVQTYERVLSMNRKSNPAGKKSIVHLPDGSTVWLNSDSKLSYQAPFSEDQREIWLEGEAFFEVARDEKRPFLVHTGKVTTQVLGTSFNINSFDNEDDIAVTVLTGKVQVTASDSAGLFRTQLTTLVPGEQASFSKSDKSISVGKVDASQAILWKEKTLLFDKEPFSKVITKLERWYGVDIENLSESTNSCIVQGKYSNENLENVLTSLQYALGFEYKMDSQNKKIILQGGNCQNN
ncbi:FecR family protein [Echinicola shivajiensis]|uniref:FecR family protein n=1 Tax=Echinicola shivajiensis TaxID=1035916 RepID=UPI001BFC43DC|nr:FecR domain-containing protein [Echinicola shivajiensis]